jgi:hypothetical protein
MVPNHVHGHARKELLLGIVYFDFDRKDLMYPFCTGLNIAWGEFGPRGDKHNFAFELLIGPGINLDCNLLIEANGLEFKRGEIDLDPQILGIQKA